MVLINKEICVGCGSCVQDCAGHAIRITEDKAEVVRDCIHCGHCVAVCPTDAVSIPEYDMEDVEVYSSDSFTVNPVNFLHAVKFRRSIRRYTEKKVEQEKLARILEAGRYTATAKNEQDCTFVVVQENLEKFKALVWKEMPGIIERLKENAPDYAKAFSYFYRKWQKNPEDDTFFFNAPIFLAIANTYNILDGGLAAANIENMAVAEGLGALYSGYMMGVLNASPVLREWLGIEGKKITCCMLMGYPAVSYKRTAPRKKADILWK